MEKVVGAKVQVWLGHIAAYEKEFKKWESRVEKILKRYKDENRKSSDSSAKFNILWSNIQTLVPATFSKLPQPDVSRRFRDNDPVGRVAALILERALEFEIQHYPDYRATLKQSVYDRFLGGRGTAWARYEPQISKVSAQITEDVVEKLDYECAPVDYVHWKDFGHTIARTWEEVTGVWRRVYLKRSACIERFGKEIGSKIPLDASPDEKKERDPEHSSALIYEIWDKESKTAIWLSKSMKSIIDEKSDPLELEGFFPCPRPLFATLTNDSLVPVPDYVLYQDQAQELDTLCDRIDGLIKALKVNGVYDASIPELRRLFTEAGNTDLIPVKNWQAFAEKQGLQGAISLVDLTPIAAALKEAYLAMEQIKNQIYEIMGVADIIRGQTDPNETLGAQELKGQYASLRLRSMQEETSRYATELLQLKAQIMCKKFAPQTLVKISSVEQLAEADKPHIQPALALLVGQERMIDPDSSGPNPLRSFRIEVAADTLVQIDENAEKQNRMEFLNAVSGFIEKGMIATQQSPPIGAMVLELLKFGVAGFKVGKTIEGTIDQALEQTKQAAANPQNKPDPEMEKIKADQQAQQQKLQGDMQLEQMRLKLEEQAKLREHQLEMQIEQLKLQQEAQAERIRLQQESQAMAQEAMFEKWKAQLEAQTKITVAEITAKATVNKAQMSAADESSKS